MEISSHAEICGRVRRQSNDCTFDWRAIIRSNDTPSDLSVRRRQLGSKVQDERNHKQQYRNSSLR
jgi:hypothetical protein